MTTLTLNKLSIAEALDSMLKEPLPLRFTAYDGSAAGPEDSPYGIHLATERGLNYILTAPGDLGFGRAYVAGDLEVIGAPPGDPYEVFRLIASKLSFRRPSPVEASTCSARSGSRTCGRRPRRRRRRRRGCAAPSRGSATRWAATPRRSTTTTTSPTPSTSTSSAPR